MDVQVPAYWQDFEKITLDLSRLLWKDPTARRYGREGQSQNGVDIFGRDYRNFPPTLIGVQCKKRKNKSKGYVVPAAGLSSEEIDEEIEAAKNFAPSLEHFVIATTAPSDAKLLSHVEKYNLSKPKPKFAVSLWFWSDFLHEFEAHPELLYKYYNQILEYRKNHQGDKHYLRLLALAFDRPAMRMPFSVENNVEDFLHAITDLKQAIKQGIFKDRTGFSIDQAPVPSSKPVEVNAAYRLLEDVHSITTEGMRSQLIYQRDNYLWIKDWTLADRLNDLRKQAIDKLNQLFTQNGIEPIEIRY